VPPSSRQHWRAVVHLHRVASLAFCHRKHSAAKVEGRKGLMRATLYSCCQANKKTISRMLMIIKNFKLKTR
jgi:hypothetical protein